MRELKRPSSRQRWRLCRGCVNSKHARRGPREHTRSANPTRGHPRRDAGGAGANTSHTHGGVVPGGLREPLDALPSAYSVSSSSRSTLSRDTPSGSIEVPPPIAGDMPLPMGVLSPTFRTDLRGVEGSLITTARCTSISICPSAVLRVLSYAPAIRGIQRGSLPISANNRSRCSSCFNPWHSGSSQRLSVSSGSFCRSNNSP